MLTTTHQVQPCAGRQYLAVLGPDYQPDAMVLVKIVAPHHLPDFFTTVSEHGELLLIHRDKLKPA